MQRLVFSTVATTIFTVTTALAGPLNLNPQEPTQSYAQSRVGAIFAAPPSEPAPVQQRTVIQSNYGGGFLEMLFNPGPPQPERYYQPEPQQASAIHPSYRPM